MAAPGDRERVLELLEGRGRAWVVLDGARDPRVARLASAGGKAPGWCLYRGDLPPELLEVAPHLLQLRPGHDYADTFFRVGWRNAWGIVLASEAPQPDLYRHLRTLLMVRAEDGKSLVFRFYDPRILRQYLPSCTPEEMERFLGPVSALALEAEQPHRFHLFRRTPEGVEQVDFDGEKSTQVKTWPAVNAPQKRDRILLRSGQIGTLADPSLRAYQERMIEFVKRDFYDDFMRLDEDGVRLLVLRAKEAAAAHRMITNVEVTGMLSLMLILGEDFETRPGNEWMQDVLRSEMIPGPQKARRILQQQLDQL